MKRSKQQLIGSLAAALLAGVALTSCSQDDESTMLPAGEYPLTLTASVEGMTTRSAGKDAWEGDGTEYIAVRMGAGDTYAKYVIGNTAGTSVSPADDDQTLYWQNSDPVTITSWYPYEAQTNIDITNQSNGFAAFDFLTATAEDQPFGNTVELKFKHQMAKVSYTLIAGDGISDDDLSNAIVLFAGYTTASFSEGALTGATDGWITPTSEDVLLVPQNMSGKQFIKVSINGSSYAFTPTDADLQAGCHYTYNITVSAEGLEVTASSSIAWGSGSTASGTVEYTYSDDNGVRTYTVYTEDGLLAWAEYVLNGNYATNCTLAKDITLTTPASGSSNWTAIGNYFNQYTGTFDGNGHTITNLTISASSAYQGLIGYLGSDGVVKNLTLDNVSISSDNISSIGGVVGCSDGTVTNCCFASGNVSSQGDFVGGVVGYNYNNGSVTACYSTGSVSGSRYVGGVVGYNNGSGSVIACYYTGSVSGTSGTGGVLGTNNGSGSVTACYYSSTTSDSYATKVEGTVTWSTAKEAMNEALTGTGWQYDGDGTSDPPLTLVTE